MTSTIGEVMYLLKTTISKEVIGITIVVAVLLMMLMALATVATLAVLVRAAMTRSTTWDLELMAAEEIAMATTMVPTTRRDADPSDDDPTTALSQTMLTEWDGSRWQPDLPVIIEEKS